MQEKEEKNKVRNRGMEEETLEEKSENMETEEGGKIDGGMWGGGGGGWREKREVETGGTS